MTLIAAFVKLQMLLALHGAPPPAMLLLAFPGGRLPCQACASVVSVRLSFPGLCQRLLLIPGLCQRLVLTSRPGIPFRSLPCRLSAARWASSHVFLRRPSPRPAFVMARLPMMLGWLVRSGLPSDPSRLLPPSISVVVEFVSGVRSLHSRRPACHLCTF